MDILLVEDHRDIAENIADFFEARGHDITLAMDGVSTLKLLEQRAYDILILDIMLPRLDGLSCLRSIREKGIKTPVLVLTARDTLEDKLAGFEAGADDYLVKPFALPELLVRIEALYRRAGQSTQERHFSINGLEINVDAHHVTREGRVIYLNRTCFALLICLARSSPRPVPRSQLEREIWGDDRPDSDALRTHLYHLRQLIDHDFDQTLIKTVRGVGVRLGLVE